MFTGLAVFCAEPSTVWEPVAVRQLVEDCEVFDGAKVEVDGLFLRGEFEFQGFVANLRLASAGEYASRGGEVYSRLPAGCLAEEDLWTKSSTGRSAWIRLQVRGKFHCSPEPTGPEPGYLYHLRIEECLAASDSPSGDHSAGGAVIPPG